MGRAIFISFIKLYLMPGMVPEIYRKDTTVVENEIEWPNRKTPVSEIDKILRKLSVTIHGFESYLLPTYFIIPGRILRLCILVN